ncbi:FAD-binding protein [Streptomonospora litoralis]|uniref:Putative decaprenylphosphoryl-beta-D-ribose oxidase n=1 Tax=Streptomonospora litoralis TaxID=2498135 RepID=A0A4P6Q226_9ACTN|nr:FAD-binding oxidoreductase [Streptomonospora litoralis]QBI52794.1 putative decaprenylphosphoryl-beta-D-ribose oxidase [Streptomonospora litoralis]
MTGTADGGALLTGWGRTAPTAATLRRPRTVDEAAELLRAASSAPGARRRGTIARGLGRSYGDAAQCAGGIVLDCADLAPGFRIEPGSGRVTAAAGTPLGELMARLLPLGLFLPVVPGTRHVTVGGAIGADVHGKNHPAAGSFGAHLHRLRLLTPDGAHRELAPDRDPELFWATVGGMGLTGVITEAEFSAVPVETAAMRVDTDRVPDLDAALAAMSADSGGRPSPYAVCWLDLLAGGSALGRGVLTRARHALPGELPRARRRDPLAYAPRPAAAVPAHVPPRLLNSWSVRAYNAAYHAKAPRRERGRVRPLASFFHPLDVVRGWNRLYGPRGLVQYQFAVPFGAEDALRRVAADLARAGAPSFLAVLKRLGQPAPAPLSFPVCGWTLALDLPAELPGLAGLLRRLDERVLAAGGRLYLAKDSRAAAETVHAMYPRLAEWRTVRDRADPDGVLTSDLARRLELCGQPVPHRPPASGQPDRGADGAR